MGIVENGLALGATNLTRPLPVFPQHVIDHPAMSTGLERSRRRFLVGRSRWHSKLPFVQDKGFLL